MDAPETLEERLVMQGKPLCDEAFRAITDRNREIARLTAELAEAQSGAVTANCLALEYEGRLERLEAELAEARELLRRIHVKE